MPVQNDPPPATAGRPQQPQTLPARAGEGVQQRTETALLPQHPGAVATGQVEDAAVAGDQARRLLTRQAVQVTGVRQRVGEGGQGGDHGGEQPPRVGVVGVRALRGEMDQAHQPAPVPQRPGHAVPEAGRADPLGVEPAVPEARTGVLGVLRVLRDGRRQLPPYDVAVPRGGDELSGQGLRGLGRVADARDLDVGSGQRVDREQGRRVQGQRAGEFAQGLRGGRDGVALAGEHADAGGCRDLVMAGHGEPPGGSGTMSFGA